MYRFLSRAAIAFVIFVAGLVLIGWQFDVALLKHGLLLHAVTMKANTAFGFLLSGSALAALQVESRLKPSRIKPYLKSWVAGCAVLTLLIGLLTLSEYGLGWNLGIDEWLFQDDPTPLLTAYPGRMGANTAFNFVLIGTAILCLIPKTSRQTQRGQLLACLAASVAWLALIGYLFNVSFFYTLAGGATAMALHTALSFLALCIGILLLRPRQGLMRVFSSSLTGGKMMRQLLPWAIALPVILKGLMILTERANYHAPSLSHPIEAVIITIGLTSILWRNARSLNQTEQDLRRMKANLEVQVVRRTRELEQSNQRLQASESKLSDILNTANVAIASARIYPDQTWEYEYLSNGYERLFGYTVADFLANKQLWASQIVPDDRETVVGALLKSISTSQTITCEGRFYHRDGSLRWLLLTVTSRWDKAAGHWIATCACHDISERKHIEKLLRQQAEREQSLSTITQRIRQSLDLQEILATTVIEVQHLLKADRVLLYQFQAKTRGIVATESVNPAYPAILNENLPDEEFPWEYCTLYRNGRIRSITDLEQDTKISPCLADMLKDLQVKAKLVVPIVWHSEAPNQPEDDLWGLLIAHQCDAPRQWQPSDIELLKQIATQVGIAIQQSELYQQLHVANRQLEQLSTTDGLTQVANRRYFDRYLEQEWLRLAREQGPLALILCDVDYFKQYNDTYGHPAGDLCLIQVAQAIRAAIKRPADLVARYGGEEFAIILPNTDQDGAVQVVQLIQREMDQRKLDHAAVPSIKQLVTLSFGLASTYPNLHYSSEDLINWADRALYQAKTQGRDRYCVASIPECLVGD